MLDPEKEQGYRDEADRLAQVPAALLSFGKRRQLGRESEVKPHEASSSILIGATAAVQEALCQALLQMARAAIAAVSARRI